MKLWPEIIDYFDAMPALEMTQKEWAPIQTQFEIDYKATATPTSTVAKLPEVKQGPDETVNNYFSRANRILLELKTKIDPEIIDIPDITLPAVIAA